MRRLSQSIIFVLLICACILAKAQSDYTFNNGEQTQLISFPTAGCSYTWTNSKPGIGLAASGSGDIPSFTAINNGTTDITATIKVTPILASYAYIANDNSNTMTVIDGVKHQVIHTISGIGTTPIGIVASPDGKRVYTANNVSGDVSVINTADNSLVTNIPVGANPFAIAITPDSRWVYVGVQGDANIAVIDAETNMVVKYIPNIQSVVSMITSPDGKWVYAATEAGTNAEVYIISTLTNIVDSGIPLDTWQNDGMVITPDGKTLYISNNQGNGSPDGTVTVINLVTKGVSKITVGTRPSPLAFTSGPYGIAINSTGTRVYVVCSYKNEIDVINTVTNTVIKSINTIPLGHGVLFTVSVSNDDKEIYVTNRNANEVYVFSAADYSKITTITDPSFDFPFSSGNFISKGPGCSASPFTFTITVKPSVPTLVAPNTAGGTISACKGSSSENPNIQQFTLSGSSLTAGVTVQAPVNFEISLDPGFGYTASLSLTPAAGNLAKRMIYVRSKQSAPLGSISGNVNITSAGATALQVKVNGKVNAVPSVNPLGPKIYDAGVVTTPITLTGPGNTYIWTNDKPSIGLADYGLGNIPSFTTVNTTNSPVVANITVTPISAGFAYVANQTSNDVSVINTSTYRTETTIPVGKGPLGAVVSPDGSRVYVINIIDKTVSVINTTSNLVIATLPVGDSPHGLAISPDGSKVYVANMNASNITVINTATNNVTTIQGIDHPYGIVTSPDGATLYVTGYQTNKLYVVNSSTGNIDASISVGINPGELAVSPDGGKVYVSNHGENTVSIIDADIHTLLNNLTVGLYPAGIAVSADGTQLYVANSGSGTVSLFNANNNVLMAIIPVGDTPNGISFTSDNYLFVANSQSSNISVISPSLRQVISTITTGKNPSSFGSFITRGASCTGNVVKFKITINASPNPLVINVGPVAGAILACAGSPSTSPNVQQFTVSGSGLSHDINATAPPNFEVSLSANSGFGPNVTVKQSAGKITDAIVYVRAAALPDPGDISGDVVLAYPGEPDKAVSVYGTINPLNIVYGVVDQVYENGDVTAAGIFEGTGIFTWTNDLPSIGLAASGTGNLPSFTAVNNTPGAVKANIMVTPQPAGFAYITNSSDRTVSIVNTSNNQVTATISTGTKPSAVAVSTDNRYAYIVNNVSNSVSVIDVANNHIKTTINVGSGPTFAVVSPDGKYIYVTTNGKGVEVIDAATNAVIIDIPVGAQPLEAAITPDGKTLYVIAGTDALFIIETATRKVSNTITVDSPGGLLMSPDGKILYVTNMHNHSVTAINTSTNLLAKVIPVVENPLSMAISSDEKTLFVVNSIDNGILSIINIATNAVTNVPVGRVPTGVSITPDNKYIYVTNYGSNNVSVVSAATAAVVSTISTGNGPMSLGSFVTMGSGCPGIPLKFTITIYGTAARLSAGPVTGIITTCFGSASASPNLQQFTVFGQNLTSDVTAKAPANFEVSLSENSGFGSSVILSPTSGKINNALVYVRMAASAPAGDISGNMSLSSTGAPNVTFGVNGKVRTLATVNLVPDQIKLNGDNTDAVKFTGAANGFIWTNDNPSIGLAASGFNDIPSFKAINNTNADIKATITVVPESNAYAYMTSQSTRDITVIDLIKQAPIKTIRVGELARGVAVTRDESKVYVASFGSKYVSVIRTVDNSIISNILFDKYPGPIAVSPDGTRVYVGTSDGPNNEIVVINAETNQVITTIKVNSDVMALEVSPDGKWLYTSIGWIGNTSFYVYNTATNTLAYQIPIERIDIDRIVISPDGNTAYLDLFNNHGITVINLKTRKVVADIDVTGTPVDIALTPDGKFLYVVVNGYWGVTVINTATNKIITNIKTNGNPQGLSVSKDGKKVYVGNWDPSVMDVISTESNTIVKSIAAGENPFSTGNFLTNGTGCEGIPQKFTITIKAQAPALIAGPVTGTITACAGMPSASPNIQQFSVTGTGLTDDAIVKAPVNFEVSLSANSGFSSSVTLKQSGGAVDNVKVYVRSAASAPAGPVNGKIVLGSAGLSDLTFGVTGQVNALSTVNAVSNQTKTSGEMTDAIKFAGTGNQFRWTNDKPEIGLSVSGIGDIASFKAINTGSADITATLTVTPLKLGYAYIPNLQSNSVSVVSLASNSVIKRLPVGNNPIGVTISSKSNLVYITSAGGTTLSVIDPEDNTVKQPITVGNSPYGIKQNADGSLLFTANLNSNNVSVIDPVTNTVQRTIDGFTGPIDVAFSADGKKMYVSNNRSNTVTVINTADYTVQKAITVGSNPYGLCLSPDGSKLFVANNISLDISVINTATDEVVSTIKGNFSPIYLGISPDGSKLYVPNVSLGNISVVDIAANTVVATIGGFQQPTGISFSTDGKYFYVTDQNTNLLSVIDAGTNNVVANIAVDKDPVAIGNFLLPGNACDGSPVTFTITVKALVPAAISSDQPQNGVNTVYGTPSSATTFTISGDHMREGIKITPPAGVEVSSDGINFSNTIIVGGAGTIPPTTIYVRLGKTTPVGPYGGPIDLTSEGANTVSPQLPSSAVSPAAVTVTANAESKDYGTVLTGAPGSMAFVVNGLQNNETAQTITVAFGAGAAAADPVNIYSGSIMPSDLAGGTFDPKNYTITYFKADLTVNKVPLEIIADNKTKVYKDPNPNLTITYKGFVNGETAAQLTAPPVISTTADDKSLPGKYPIAVSGATSPNYDIKFSSGVLTIKSAVLALKIPNTFTPNGDGVNDTWNILNIEAYPDCSINIFNRWGQKVYSSIGYVKSWDGQYNNAPLPVSTYYYIIDLKDGSKAYSGDITIIR